MEEQEEQEKQEKQEKQEDEDEDEGWETGNGGKREESPHHHITPSPHCTRMHGLPLFSSSSSTSSSALLLAWPSKPTC